MSEILKLSDKLTCLPVIHGSGDFSIAVRHWLLQNKTDCVAVPLPPSVSGAVERGIDTLPAVSVAVQEETAPFQNMEWSPEASESSQRIRSVNYVPIDPCQPVIAALRIAIGEHIARAYVDLEVEQVEVQSAVLPDPYALKRVSIEQFATAVLPTIRRPTTEQHLERIDWMAKQLRELEQSHESIVFICSITDWPWIREAYREQAAVDIAEPAVHETALMKIPREQLIFALGELPFVAGCYEQARFNLDDDENLSVDGIKEMLIAARESYREELKQRGRKITPHLLRTILRYVRNLCLMERRLTPDLYTLITAAKQIAGDQFAISLAEVAREYPFECDHPLEEFHFSTDRGQLPNGDVVEMKNRLPGHPVSWRSLELRRRPPKLDQEQWQMQWNPFRQCSWPPEDVAIERFRTHVKDRALAMMGNDLARTEKFTSSLKDGIDIRETLRNWHTGNLYVKENPPSRGSLDCVLMLFDSPADPREYPWRITWHAEHQDESTLSFFATHYQQEHVGPGIALSTYGGAMFLFPPRPVEDVWHDHRFDFVDTLEERLLVAACLHSTERHIAVLSHSAPGVGWKRLAKKYSKKLIHIPLGHFSQETVQQLRMFHVLNGQQVRSYAEHFIRKA